MAKISKQLQQAPLRIFKRLIADRYFFNAFKETQPN